MLEIELIVKNLFSFFGLYSYENEPKIKLQAYDFFNLDFSIYTIQLFFFLNFNFKIKFLRY
jgi:hypothetical protein